MSLVAALLIGSSAFAIDNVKVSGDAKLYYGTSDEQTTNGNGVKVADGTLFNRGSAAGQAELGLGLTADLTKGVSTGVHATVLSTLGLENNLVSGTWAGNIAQSTPATTNGAGSANLEGANGTAWWIDQAWIAATAGKTTGKIGRMELDTPLAFTEKWNIAENTFEAAVLINQDIPDTTLVAAYVGGSNGDGVDTVRNAQNGITPFRGYTSYNSGVADALGINGFGGAGAYAVGVVNNSVKPLTVQAWYYDVREVADAYWLQGDVNVGGILAGAQYANMKLKDTVTNVGSTPINVAATVAADNNINKTTDAYALMVGYEMKDVVTIKAAYSQVADDGILSIQNTATGTESKLYTEAWWNYGVVGQAGAKSYMINATTTVADVELLAQYTHSDVDHKGNASKAKADEFALTASKSFGPLDTTLAYVYSKATNGNANAYGYNIIHGLTGTGADADADATSKSNMIQAYLTLNF